MSLEQKVRLLAGTLVLASLALGWWVSSWFFLLTTFVGLNLVQSAFSGWCLAEDIMKCTGIHREPPAGGSLAGRRDPGAAAAVLEG